MNYEVPSYQESINVLVKFTQFNYKFMVIEKLKINLRILDTFILLEFFNDTNYMLNR